VTGPGPPPELAIRPERPGDEDPIWSVHAAAFGQAAEADLVARLRAAGDLVLSVVAEDGAVAGHVAFPRLFLESEGRSIPAVALAPLAVSPERQRRGIGQALVRAGLETLARGREGLVLVRGDPAFYERFGFRAGIAASLTTPYRDSHYMGLVLNGAEPPPGASVRYPAAFAGL